MENLTQILKNLGGTKLAIIAGTIFASLMFFVYLMVRASSIEMSPLFTQLESSDGARILERLKALGVPTEVRNEDNQILVPSDQVARLRMELAQDGLPAGGSIGYELFDKNDLLGSTSAILDINHARALEGEISKSIRTIQGVQSARVHLAIPKRELFAQEKQTAAASIVLKMRGTARLSATQVQSIQHLVASAVPNLTLDKISIVDDRGNLLARGVDVSGAGDGFGVQQDIRQGYEDKLVRTVESLLEKAIGPGKARAEISADMDFDKVTSTSVEFNPDGQVARSSTTTEDGSNSNETPSQDTVSLQNALPENAAAGAGSQNRNQTNRSEENITYEISSTTKTHVKETGGIKRLSVAVLVDGNYSKDEKGKSSYSPRSNEEIEQLTTLIKTAVGFKEDRGDTVKIVNIRFVEPEEERLLEESKWYRGLNVSHIAVWAIVGSLALALLFGVIRPVLLNLSNQHTLVAAGPAGALHYFDENPTQDSLQTYPTPVKKETRPGVDVQEIDDRVKASITKKIGEIIDNHPEETVAIFRSWMNSDT
ncbi:MAG: flagellar basal-body MS-ring/collar protein FliF [Alphaproteobacteria bacterium]|nr:flagellar basal-body MS-ring/collar protein FliF [Alphaproteobacteria bacterium]